MAQSTVRTQRLELFHDSVDAQFDAKRASGCISGSTLRMPASDSDFVLATVIIAGLRAVSKKMCCLVYSQGVVLERLGARVILVGHASSRPRKV